MKMTEYKGCQITTELYGKGFTWMYRLPITGWIQQPPNTEGEPTNWKYIAYPTREAAIQGAREEIDKL